MSTNPGPGTFAAAQKTARVIWLALSAVVFIYGGLLVMLSRNTWEPGGQEVAPMIQWALAFAALASAGASMFFHRVQYSPEKVVSRAGSEESRAAAEFQTGHIVAWAQAESVAVFGLVLAFLGQQLSFYLPFALVALTLLAAERPDVAPYQRAFEEGRG